MSQNLFRSHFDSNFRLAYENSHPSSATPTHLFIVVKYFRSIHFFDVRKQKLVLAEFNLYIPYRLYQRTYLYRDLKLRGAILKSGQLIILPQEQVINKI